MTWSWCSNTSRNSQSMDDDPALVDEVGCAGPFVESLVDFGRAVRAEGVNAGSGELLTFCAAVATLNPGDLVDIYWAGRTTLLSKHDQIPVYDRVFRSYFLGLDERDQSAESRVFKSDIANDSVVEVPATEPGEPGKDQEEAKLGLMASDMEVWRNKAFAGATEEELQALRRIIRQMKLIPPRRRTRRHQPSRSQGSPDLRRTMRATMRQHGEPSRLYWRRRKPKLRPLILILDVSGSMSDYSRQLLQFAYSARRASSKVEVFCFGTRLTRITPALDRRRPDDALDHAARTVFDWEGGTRIGHALDTFVRDYGRRGLSRGSIVVICSDGLDRGDPSLLADALEKLSMLCHKIVWVNPHVENEATYRATTLGMMVAEPYIDLLLSGRDLTGFEELAGRLPALR